MTSMTTCLIPTGRVGHRPDPADAEFLRCNAAMDMVSQGEVQSVAALLDAAQAAPEGVPGVGVGVGVRHTAAQNARACRDLLATGEGLDACWRFGILQTLDDYTSVLRRGGPALAAGVFADEPEPTGAEQLDAGFAALADHLAERDGWQAPAWTLSGSPDGGLVSSGSGDLAC